jgi:hypothetical protein
VSSCSYVTVRVSLLVVRFDADNNGCLYSKDFVKGCMDLSTQPGGSVIVDKIGALLGEDNVML